jgi:predicted nucleotidyltransferase
MKTTMERVVEHYNESLQFFTEDQVVGLFLQGSQNYGLDYEGSDVDTKLIVVPSFKDICLNHKPVSTTHVRENDEHTDWKDIRLYVETFRKQNLNFLEILFTPYFILNPLYKDQWMRLVEHREEIAHMNVNRAVKSMKGVAMEKYHAMEHAYPSKVDVLAKWGYDPKQLHHLLRVEEYLTRYINGDSYEACLRPYDPEYLIDVKRGKYSLETARKIANSTINHIEGLSSVFCDKHPEQEDPAMRELLEDVSYNIMKIAVKKELGV